MDASRKKPDWFLIIMGAFIAIAFVGWMAFWIYVSHRDHVPLLP